MTKDPIILITDPKVLAIPIKECAEECVDLKEVGGIKYGPPPETPETEPDYTIIRKSVYEKLLEAQKMLPDSIKFRLYEGYRNLEVQQMLFDQEYSRVEKTMPHLSEEETFIETTKLVSPVINPDGTKNIPAHSSGGAFDVELIDENGTPLDMGMEAKDWVIVDPKLCESDCDEISDEARKNRDIMSGVLSKIGFINYRTEWWHWSYGDRYWAYHTNQPNAIYGSIER